MPTRFPAVAGSFYPAEPAALRDEVARCLAAAHPSAPAPSGPPKMLVVPHAGTAYSGPVAASAYALLTGDARKRIRRVVLLGPAHRVPVRGLAAPTVAAFATPLGEIPLDQSALRAVAELPFVELSDRAHEWEHSLELQLPFLQQVLGRGFTLVPLVVGDARPNEVAQVLEQLWGADETLVLISSDLSHFLPYAAARERDGETLERLLAFDSDIEPDEACGCHALNGALIVARRHGLQPRLLDARNSGDTAGDRRRVVGYAALAFEAPASEDSGRDEADERADDLAWGRAAFAVARNAIARDLGEPLVDEPPHPLLDAPGACFVSLHDRESDLRGCIGRLEPEGPLREDLRSNARSAAFRDSRFAPLAAHEWPGLKIEVSLLGPLQPVPVRNEAEALAAVRPGIDGLVISWHGRRATLLPQVWQQLPAPSAFFAALKHKAGLRTDFWAPDVELQRFEVRHYEGTV
ncbi:AmmeMemoRadiSam system protein B [Ideonella sp. YS5]